MIKVKSVSVNQAEGEVGKLVVGEFPTIEDGCSALRRIMRQCPPDMLGYLKTDVVITWEDGSTHCFRADVNQHGDDTNLTVMLRDWAKRNEAGSTLPNVKHLLGDAVKRQWEEQARRILEGELEIL